MPALVLCTSTRHTGVHLLAQADTQESYSSHMHFPKHQTHRSSTPRTCIYVHVCISLLCTHSFFFDVYSCLSLRWAHQRLGHPLKDNGAQWVNRNPHDSLSRTINLTSAEAAARATPQPMGLPPHLAKAMQMAESIVQPGNQANIPQPPPYPPPFSMQLPSQQDGIQWHLPRGIVVPPTRSAVFGRTSSPGEGAIMPFGASTNPGAAFGPFQQGIILGSLMHTCNVQQTENDDLRQQLARFAQAQAMGFPI